MIEREMGGIISGYLRRSEKELFDDKRLYLLSGDGN
jgi:hypothetical protein